MTKKKLKFNIDKELIRLQDIEYSKYQKTLYEQLALKPAFKLYQELKQQSVSSSIEEELETLNSRLEVLVKEVWQELYLSNKLLVSFESVLPKYVEKENDVPELKLTGNLVCLMYGKLDRQLTPLDVNVLLASKDISVF